MNTRIFLLIVENLKKSLNLPKYTNICNSIDQHTCIDDLPLTPARKSKFVASVTEELDITTSIDLSGTILDLTTRLDVFYTGRFFGQIWKPTTESHKFTGWDLVNQVNFNNPTRVLDYGCGYNQFKDKIKGLIGIDPYNESADYMVDIFSYSDNAESFDAILALGSLNFNSQDELENRMERLVYYLKPGGFMYFRANPGITWPAGKYVDIFPWSFEFVVKLAKDYCLSLESFKIDSGKNGERFYFVYRKNSVT